MLKDLLKVSSKTCHYKQKSIADKLLTQTKISLNKIVTVLEDFAFQQLKSSFIFCISLLFKIF